MALTEWLRQRIENAIDSISESFSVVDSVHRHVHLAKHYSVNFSTTVNAGENIDVLLTCPNTSIRAHMIAEFTANNTGTIYMYEAPTINANGTSMVEYNNDRNSSNVTTVVATHTPTVGAVGTTVIFQEILGTNTPPIKIGGDAGNRHEYILKQNTKYLFRFTATNNSTTGNWNIYWYEE